MSWGISLIVVSILAVPGFMIGFGLINKFFLSKNESTKETTNKIKEKLGSLD
ncbi:hypothetical protein [Aquimarina sp. RZ0]|uniref:hypothetical protein n=1 Tax=Aquimarina sp. RZ0 TaxID=2607730 RepID=UPI00165EC64D|nr:hypothetical protein [Aquimarina sp. RZ0]